MSNSYNPETETAPTDICFRCAATVELSDYETPSWVDQTQICCSNCSAEIEAMLRRMWEQNWPLISFMKRHGHGELKRMASALMEYEP